jgi:hypothetical protein
MARRSFRAQRRRDGGGVRQRLDTGLVIYRLVISFSEKRLVCSKGLFFFVEKGLRISDSCSSHRASLARVSPRARMAAAAAQVFSPASPRYSPASPCFSPVTPTFWIDEMELAPSARPPPRDKSKDYAEYKRRARGTSAHRL